MKTRILLTIGDFNGIGPEIILKTLLNKSLTEKYDLTVLSPVSVLEFYAKLLKRKFYADDFNIIPFGSEKIKVNPGKISPEGGSVAGIAIVKAIEMCMHKDYDAIVTAPISKEALNNGGFYYEGHTDMLRDFGKVKEVCMMMVSDKIKVALATNHPPLQNVSSVLTRKMLQDKLTICYNSLKKDFAVKSPGIGILALNPHAGDGGVIGKEEIEVINPVVKSLNKKFGKAFSYPFAADGYFASGSFKNYDLTFAMYHDQGLIPFKMLAGMQGINYTAGLSFVRTSPDHGTAFDIAGKNIASQKSLTEAIKWADRIFRNKHSSIRQGARSRRTGKSPKKID
ncbi:MAG TPA: 4-hydroxythreonine-4-phosphate dehydrogenase PdxA [Ignavibacteria bacterium]